MIDDKPLTVQQIYQRYMYRVKCHEKLQFNFNEFCDFCRKNRITKSDWLMCTKPFAKEISLDDFVIYRNGKMGDDGGK